MRGARGARRARRDDDDMIAIIDSELLDSSLLRLLPAIDLRRAL